MTFAHPNLLWLLALLLPGMVVFHLWASRKRQQLLTRFIEARLLPGLLAGVSPGRQRLRFWLLLLASACLVVTLARPQWGFTWEEARQRGLDIAVAIDTSKSMLAEDIMPNRLARARLAALDLMQQAKSDRLGLVAFAGTAFLQCPLTIDDSAFRQAVESLDVNTLPQGGTAIGAAIRTALKAFKEDDNVKVLVLFTDGEDHDPDALKEAEEAAKAGLEIFTIGVGTPEGEMVRAKAENGTPDFVRDEQGNAVKSKLNEDLLRQIAGATARGFYLPLKGPKTVDTLFEQGLAPLPKTDAQQKFVRQQTDRYHWPLGAAIVLIICELLLPERLRRKKSTRAAPENNLAPGAKAAVLAMAFALAFSGSARASTGSALREYNKGQYEQALREYLRLLEKNPDDPRLNFNAGAAAYQEGQIEEAMKQFGKALTSPDLNVQRKAYYNRGNTLYRMGERDPDLQKKREAWQKSIQDYGSALKLNPQDSDAKHNQEFVKERLEELKQQQQNEQNQDKDDKPDKQDQQQQQNQQGQNNQQQGQQQNQQQTEQRENQQQQQTQQEQQDQQNKVEQQKAQAEQQQAAEQKQTGKQEQKAAAGEGKEGQGEMSDVQMTPEQARQLLDSQKGDEQVLQFKPEKPTNAPRSFKDW